MHTQRIKSFSCKACSQCRSSSHHKRARQSQFQFNKRSLITRTSHQKNRSPQQYRHSIPTTGNQNTSNQASSEVRTRVLSLPQKLSNYKGLPSKHPRTTSPASAELGWSSKAPLFVKLQRSFPPDSPGFHQWMDFLLHRGACFKKALNVSSQNGPKCR